MSSGALLMGFKVWLDHWIWAGRGTERGVIFRKMDEKQLWGGVAWVSAVCCLDVDVAGWASKMYEVWLIIVRLRCSCPRAVSPLSSALGTLQLRPDSFDGNYCLRNYFTDQTHFLSERNFNISNYRGSQQRESTRVYLQMWSLIRPQLELRQYL